MSQARTFIVPLLVLGSLTVVTLPVALFISAAIVDIRFAVIPWVAKQFKRKPLA